MAVPGSGGTGADKSSRFRRVDAGNARRFMSQKIGFYLKASEWVGGHPLLPFTTR